jgi:hypothetical protein
MQTKISKNQIKKFLTWLLVGFSILTAGFSVIQVESQNNTEFAEYTTQSQKTPLSSQNLNELGNFSNLNCTPSNPIMETEVDCEGLLPAAMLPPEGNLKLSINSQNVTDCTFLENNFNCVNLPAGFNIDCVSETDCNGSLPVYMSAIAGTFNISFDNISLADCSFQGKNFTCTNVPEGVSIACVYNPNNSSDCTGTLPKQTLPTDGNLKITITGQNYADCTFTGSIFNCEKLPTGVEINCYNDDNCTGTLPFDLSDFPGTLEFSLNNRILAECNFEKKDFECQKIPENAVINCEPGNLPSLTDSVCSGYLPPLYLPPVGDLSLSIDGVTNSLCVFEGQNFKCENLYVGNDSGEGNILAKVNNSEYIFVGTKLLIRSGNNDILAVNDSSKTYKNLPVEITLLANDEGKNLQITNTTATSNGFLTLTQNQTVIYQPNADFIGNDSFFYTIQNEFGSSNATVSITVEDALAEIKEVVISRPDTTPQNPQTVVVVSPIIREVEVEVPVETEEDGEIDEETNELPTGIEYQTVFSDESENDQKFLDVELDFQEKIEPNLGREMSFSAKDIRYTNGRTANNQICQFIITTASLKRVVLQQMSDEKGDCIAKVVEPETSYLDIITGNINTFASIKVIEGQISYLFEKIGPSSFYVRLPSSNGEEYVSKELNFIIPISPKSTTSTPTNINSFFINLGLVSLAVIGVVIFAVYGHWKLNE